MRERGPARDATAVRWGKNAGEGGKRGAYTSRSPARSFPACAGPGLKGTTDRPRGAVRAFRPGRTADRDVPDPAGHATNSGKRKKQNMIDETLLASLGSADQEAAAMLTQAFGKQMATEDEGQYMDSF